MTRHRHRIVTFIIAAALAAGFLAALPATAEVTIPVNDPDTGVFDQPAVAVNGSVAHVAYIGDNTASGTYRVFYAAVNGAADFSNLSLPRDNTVILTFPTALDNTGSGGNSPYFDARHPKIAVRSSTEVVILFQARPTSLDTVFRPYIARVTLSGNSVTAQSVLEVTGFPAGTIEDISFGLVTTDNTVRMAFSNNTSIGASAPFQVHFARVGLDNAIAVGAPLPLSSGGPPFGSNGFHPLPTLKLDDLNRSHVAWAADDGATAPNGIYYALVKETGGTDNVAIAATEVVTRSLAWRHPNLLVINRSSIVILAADESNPGFAGSMGLVKINPDADNQDGTPAYVALNSTFLVTPPGQAILPSIFDLWRPGAIITPSGRIHVTGYGSNGTRATYYAFQATDTYPYAELLTAPVQVGSEIPPEYPDEMANDYTHAALGFFGTKALVFWSGEIPPGGNRNLDVTGLPAPAEPTPPIPVDESGCSAIGNGPGGARWAFLLLAPAALFGWRTRYRRKVVR